jgi:predicted homoserine dehydrogenase-like protein
VWSFEARLDQLEREGKPITVGVIGAGRFGTLALIQLHRMAGVRIAVVADLDTGRALVALERAGVDLSQVITTDRPGEAEGAIREGMIVVTGDSSLASGSRVDVVLEATGSVEAGCRHALDAIALGKHVVMATVEADVLAGPILKHLADEAGVTYSLAYGDQPALIKELFDWATSLGFDVVAAGKGTKFLPEFRESTPDTVWGHYGHTDEEAERAGLNPKMYNSFLDGTKSAVEMVAVSNMTGLVPDVRGMHFPAASIEEIPSVLCPQADGGILHSSGVVEVVSSVYPDGSAVPNDIRWGVFVVFGTDSDYGRRAMAEYGVPMGGNGAGSGAGSGAGNGKYGVMYRPYHFVGLETPISVVTAALRGEATGAPMGAPVSEVITVAKRPLQPGDVLDGDGGYTVYGEAERAPVARAENLLPMGLSDGATVTRPVAQGTPLTRADVALKDGSFAADLRTRQDLLFPS